MPVPASLSGGCVITLSSIEVCKFKAENDLIYALLHTSVNAQFEKNSNANVINAIFTYANDQTMCDLYCCFFEWKVCNRFTTY